MPNQPAENRRMVSFRMHRDVVTAAKAEAERRGQSLTQLVEDALRREIASPVTPHHPATQQTQP